MTWIARVTNKGFSSGTVNVTVEYTDGVDTILETYRTVMPDVNWIPEKVRDRLYTLETSSTFDISIDVIEPAPTTPAQDPNIQLFRHRCRLLEIAKVMIDLDIVQPTHPKVIALGDWISNNINEYFDTL